MRPSFLILLAIGFGFMFWLWNEEWEYNQPPERFAPVAGCLKGVACEAPWDQCAAHPKHTDGLCTTGCQFSKDCPGEWCCLPVGDALRCVPPEECKAD